MVLTNKKPFVMNGFFMSVYTVLAAFYISLSEASVILSDQVQLYLFRGF